MYLQNSKKKSELIYNTLVIVEVKSLFEDILEIIGIVFLTNLKLYYLIIIYENKWLTVRNV